MDELLKLIEQVQLYRQRGADPALLDRYVAEKTGGMVPSVAELDKIAKKTDVNARNVGRAGTMGALFGFADELAGLGNMMAEGEGYGDTDAYKRTRDQVREDYGTFREAHPAISLGSEVAGGLLVPVGAATSAPRAGFLAALGRGAGVGAGAGAVSGAGYSDSPEEMPGDMAGGAAAGLVLGGLLSGGAAGVRRMRGSLAQRRLQRALNEAGGADAVRAADAAARAAGRGDVATVADLHPRLAKEADFATQNNPSVASDAELMLERRTADAPQRLLGDFEELLGELPNAGARRAALDAERAAVGDFYDVLVKTAPNLKGNARLEGTLLDLRQKGLLMGRAKRFAQEALETGEYKAYNELRKLLRGQQDAIFRNPSPLAVKDDARALARAADELDDVLADEVPGFAEQQAKYRAEVARVKALDEGLEAVKQSNARELKAQVAAMSPQQLEQFRYGVASGLVDELSSVATNRDAAARYIHASSDLEAKLKLVFETEEQFQEFMQRASVEHNMARTRSVTHGSQTHARGVNAQLDPMEVMMPGAGAGVVSRIGNAARNAFFRERNANAAKQVGAALLTPGSGIDDLLLLLDQMNRRRTLGGVGQVVAPSTAGLLSGR